MVAQPLAATRRPRAPHCPGEPVRPSDRLRQADDSDLGHHIDSMSTVKARGEYLCMLKKWVGTSVISALEMLTQETNVLVVFPLQIFKQECKSSQSVSTEHFRLAHVITLNLNRFEAKLLVPLHVGKNV